MLKLLDRFFHHFYCLLILFNFGCSFSSSFIMNRKLASNSNPSLQISARLNNSNFIPTTNISNYTLFGDCENTNQLKLFLNDLLVNESISCTNSTWSTAVDLSGYMDGSISVKIKSADSSAAELFSTTIIKDQSPPNVAGLTIDDGVNLASLVSTPWITWTAATDLLSGLKHYEISIGTAPGLTNILNWSNQSVATSTIKYGLVLTNNLTYFVNIRAVDQCGNVSSIVSSNGWLARSLSPLNIAVRSSATNAAGTAFGQQPDLNQPSFYDVEVSASTDSILPNGVYDGWDLSPTIYMSVAPTTHSGFAASAHSSLNFVGTSLPLNSQAVIDQLNWVLFQNFTSDPKYAGQFTPGEVEVAVWKLVGYNSGQITGSTDIRNLNDNGRNVYADADADLVIAAAQAAVASGNNVVQRIPFTSVLIDLTGSKPEQLLQIGKSKIGISVWSDSIFNGVQDIAETKLDGVRIELYDVGTGDLLGFTISGDDYSTSTVESGFAEFSGLLPGTYRLKVIQLTSTISPKDANNNSNDSQDSDFDPSTSWSDVITLTTNQSVQSIGVGLN